jgi:hypothetical protein
VGSDAVLAFVFDAGGQDDDLLLGQRKRSRAEYIGERNVGIDRGRRFGGDREEIRNPTELLLDFRQVLPRGLGRR